MFKRPSSRRRGESRQIELNLVPILDTMVCLIAFLLFTTSFFAIVSVESPFPETSADQLQKEITEKPLQLTLTLKESESEIWSPFEKIAPVHIPNLAAGQPDLGAIHSALLGIKQRFPRETKIVFAPIPGVTYDILISVMDAVRTIEKADPPIFAKNAVSGTDEALKVLFPDVIFGNLMGDG